ncbi:hypothetical protein [Thermoactinomyces sp. DSM 45892]|uniref:hypothetical protein n=1 Tax=Thermoactinomyces sp. DSM 45892 TaxID=1882753 RepID=UPI000895EB24|nr:hypothetical protein [Thermoactinomyces sp. DSM 45892]SDY82970.1 hypothetical protein SAMN05444416_10913 [Thermoactinomyces sp. DSM 45892]
MRDFMLQIVLASGLDEFGKRIWDWLYPNLKQVFTLVGIVAIMACVGIRRIRPNLPVVILGLAFVGVFVYKPEFFETCVNFVYGLLK